MANGSNRPLSPHLQIYRLPLTALTSITHRITGVALSVGTVLLVWWLVAAASGPEYFAYVQDLLGSPLGLLALLGWTFALFYHLANGIRHLVWDAGYAFEVQKAELGGWVVIGAAAGLTIVSWVIGFSVR
ncbi:MAG TPA: succinate dehydrogenase, cytochrome b556 subunit [Azospirillaceae bacterium]|nr:succinate dehydrogenase, cytochrome b556 subunit [Azospirillaceae bacterium]